METTIRRLCRKGNGDLIIPSSLKHDRDDVQLRFGYHCTATAKLVPVAVPLPAGPGPGPGQRFIPDIARLATVELRESTHKGNSRLEFAHAHLKPDRVML